jgi:RNA polymerase sigma-70 factor (ECF subfamily)
MNRATTAPVGDADEVAVSRYLAGDVSAFGEIFDRHGPYVYNIVYGVLNQEDEARDVTQDVFLQVHRSLASFRHGSRFSTWLYRIALNRALDAARAHRRRRWVPWGEGMENRPDPHGDPAADTDTRSDEADVRRVLQRMEPRHRDVLVLRYMQELNIDEIAEVLGCSETAAKVRLYRARQKFKEAYEATVGTHGRANE